MYIYTVILCFKNLNDTAIYNQLILLHCNVIPVPNCEPWTLNK